MEECLLTGHTIWYKSSDSLEGDRGRDRVRQCHLFNVFSTKVHITNCSFKDFFSNSK